MQLEAIMNATLRVKTWNDKYCANNFTLLETYKTLHKLLRQSPEDASYKSAFLELQAELRADHVLLEGQEDLYPYDYIGARLKNEAGQLVIDYYRSNNILE